MAVLPLTYVPNAVLRQPARRVGDIDARVRRLIDDMTETLLDTPSGVGLAANQVGVPLRVVVIQLAEDEEPTVLINPKVVRREGERELDEACLSVPGYHGLVRRSAKVRVRATGVDGKPLRLKADGDLLAQVLEHETDHLDGRLYVDRLVSEEHLTKVSEDEEEGAGTAATQGS